jgi:protein-S-isoprenylcysteine O-methyltransferase Ste14
MNYLALITGTIVILIFSWFFSIKHGRYHGIPRFFSFECIFLLTLLNIRVWFHNPFLIHQLISWILLILSAYAGIEGYLLLKKKGRSEKNFENTAILVKSGIYKYIRHPLYLSLLLLGTGVMMKNPAVLQLILGFINLVAIFFTARIEELEMTRKFGEAYLQYKKETRMFIPYLL